MRESLNPMRREGDGMSQSDLGEILCVTGHNEMKRPGQLPGSNFLNSHASKQELTLRL